MGKPRKEGKSLANVGALKLCPGCLKAVVIWTQCPQEVKEGEKRAEDKILACNFNPGNSGFRTHKEEKRIAKFKGEGFISLCFLVSLASTFPSL